MSGRIYDAAVVGAGMVGAALACALGRAGFRVALLEQSRPERFDAKANDLRVSAISPATQNVLSNLGVWESVCKARVSPYRSMYVWDAAGGGAIRFEAADLQQDHLGHIVGNRLLQSVLLDAISGMPEIDFYCPAGIRNLHIGPDCMEIETADIRLRAALVVGADGAHSRVRELAQIGVQSWQYEQRGLIATVQTELSHERTAWQRFLPTGPLAFLPLQDGRSSIVWSTTVEQAEQLLALSEPQFCASLSEAFEHRLGKVLGVGDRQAFPLQFMHARRLIGNRIALVGDAAHVVHPLAGQGVNMGILDVAELAHCLEQARGNSSDPGGIKTLRRYERARRTENWMLGLSLDAIKRLFAAQSMPLVALRSSGLKFVDGSPLLKHFFMRKAMAIDSSVPPLAQSPAANETLPL
ncbi:MAG TPA: UbiH/UbiF/VisC/COQ6 family ubiquinone biosynthesis hydroxylase [Gammaproteobacteria bacterium]|nr:UbiH/UbiF/VisC/COQ6 family ubiquinone biosynthesis hydroxylase [Gammaproteobacteria bacterium]